MNKKDFLIITQIISNMLRAYGIALIAPIILSWIYAEQALSKTFIAMSVFCIITFTIIRKLIRYDQCDNKHALISLFLAWCIISLFSSIPFIVSGMTVIDAIFESFSGWTNTGFTMIQDVTAISQTLNFFRSYMQWISGFGIVILALVLYEKPKTAYTLFLAEGRMEDFYIDIKKISRVIIMIYAGYTVLGILLFRIGGLSFYDSIVNTMSSLSTGGFSNYNQGIASLGLYPTIISSILMLLGGISFVVHQKLFLKQFDKIRKNPEIQAMFLILIISTGIIFFNMIKLKKTFFVKAFYYIISAFTTTGAVTSLSFNEFSSLSLIILSILMIAGVSYGSASGGIKLWRFILVFKIIKREISRPFLPKNSVIPITVGDSPIDDSRALKVTAYVILYIAIILSGCLAFMMYGYTAIESLFTVASAQGNAGLTTIEAARYFSMPIILKIVLIFHMLIGRIEIFPLLIFIRSIKD